MRTIRIQESNSYRGVYDLSTLRRYVPYVKLVRLRNRVVAIISQRPFPCEELREVVVVETHKKPLYRQHMDLMCGRIPRDDVSQCLYRCSEVSEHSNGRFHVYEVV